MMPMNLRTYLQSTGTLVEAFVRELPTPFLAPDEIREGALLYFFRGGKRLRPALLRLFAGVYGGKEKEEAALPAACACELFHNWTLIHDDIIDKDLTRRGGPSVHAHVQNQYLPFADADAAFEYGTDAAILAGDALHAMSTRALTLLPQYGVDAAVALELIRLMDGEIVDRLICGEALDTRFGRIPLTVTEDEVVHMIHGKTGALFSFCSMAGTMIGLGLPDHTDPRVQNAARFSYDCGLAFQLQDDILGILSDEQTLGKPVGSDIREGKNTLIRHYAYQAATPKQKEILDHTMGNRSATDREIQQSKQVLLETGSIQRVRALAQDAVRRAEQALSQIPENPYKELICAWANTMVKRTY